MVFYLKINRNERYTFRNLQHWVDIVEAIPESKYYILCDHEELKQEVLKQVVFRNSGAEFLESCKTSAQMTSVVTEITDERWRNAGYAHLTTFWHARKMGYSGFWNIDADDTCFCLAPERVCELLQTAEANAEEEKMDILSLDMWMTRTKGYHWSFGITYVDNTADWFEIMKKYCKDEGMKSKQIRNVDGYFSCLRSCTDLKIGTFYFENLRFIHYSDDFFKRPDASGFFHWKDGKLILPILLNCFGIESLGCVPITKEVRKLDMGITDQESKEFLLTYILPEERERLRGR